MKIGDSVYHPKYGSGIIKLIIKKSDGMVFRVNFGFATLMVPVGELLKAPGGPPLKPENEIGKSGIASETIPISSPISILDEANLRARAGINALKLGQILEDQVHLLSVGTEPIEKKFKEAVEKAAGGETSFILIEGAWGSGKTHALTLLQAMARKQRLATTSVIMDGHSVSLAKAMELMGEVIGTLRFPSSGSQDGLIMGLREALRLKKVKELELKGAPLISKALSALPQGALDDPEVGFLLEDYFSLGISTSQAKYKLRTLGFPAPSLPPLKASRIVERAQAFKELLANWACFAKVMGAAGLLIIFDELDVEYAYTDWRTQHCAQLRERRDYLLNELRTLHDTPLAVAFASVPGLTMTANWAENDAIEHLHQVFQNRLLKVSVPTPNQDQMQTLFGQILELYNLAYPSSTVSLSESEKSLLYQRLWAHYIRVPNPVPRRFVRLSLEIFDLLATGTKGNFDEILQAVK